MSPNGLEKLLSIANKLLGDKKEPEEALREASDKVVSSVIYGPLLLELNYIRLSSSQDNAYFEVVGDAANVPKSVTEVATQYLYERLKEHGRDYLHGKRSFRAKDISNKIFPPVVISRILGYLARQGVVKVCDERSGKAFYKVTNYSKFRRISYSSV
jgi:hypothetical protein